MRFGTIPAHRWHSIRSSWMVFVGGFEVRTRTMRARNVTPKCQRMTSSVKHCKDKKSNDRLCIIVVFCHMLSESLRTRVAFFQGPLTSLESIHTITQACKEGRPASVEILNYRKDGTPFWNWLRIRPVEGSNFGLSEDTRSGEGR